MAVSPKLLAKAEQSPANLSFDDARKLAEQLGWVHKRTKGSHNIFHHPDWHRDTSLPPLNLQSRNGQAKPEQVADLIRRARAMGILDHKEDTDER